MEQLVEISEMKVQEILGNKLSLNVEDTEIESGESQ